MKPPQTFSFGGSTYVLAVDYNAAVNERNTGLHMEEFALHVANWERSHPLFDDTYPSWRVKQIAEDAMLHSWRKAIEVVTPQPVMIPLQRLDPETNPEPLL